MRIAVIGASSFSGQAFVDRVESDGHQVFSVNRPRFDLADPVEMVKAIVEANARVVVNFAALNMVAESWEHHADYYARNVIGVTGLAMGLRGQIDKFIQVSTPEVYGNVLHYLDERTPFNPSTPYAVSRAAADMHLLAMRRAYGFPVCITRTVNVFGPGQQIYRIIPKTVLKILRGEKLKLHGGGASERSFIHIADVARGIERVMEDGVPGETYHMATPDYHSIKDLVRSICRFMLVRFEDVVDIDTERTGKDMAYLLLDSKIRKDLGWRETISFYDGLENTIRWFVDCHKVGDFEGQSLEYQHNP